MIVAKLREIVGRVVDPAQQERIRQALLAYSRAHTIGVVKLSRRISEAHPRRPKIIVKTLQRFLAGRKVNEQLLAFCGHFVRKYDVQDRILQIGEALARLYSTETMTDISGNYVISRNNLECPVVITRESDFWRIVEHDREKARIYEGVVVHMAGVFVASLKDKAFGQPRTYHLVNSDVVHFVNSDAVFCDVNRAGQIVLIPRRNQ
jgi:hypothetical protein